jgi:SOS-response transcriptional repressor LexA
MFDLQRVRKLVNWYIFQEYGKNDAEIAERLGYEKSYFSQILNGKVSLSKSFIDKLCALDQNINKVWISGSGVMLKNEALLSQNVSEMPNTFLKNMVLKKIGLPLLSHDDVVKYSKLTEEEIQEKESYYYIREFEDQGSQFLIKISGDSMNPYLNSGDLIACRKVSKEEQIYWGKVYIIKFTNHIQVCRIYPDDTNETKYKLVSENDQLYPPIFTDKSQIRSLYQVVGVVKVM